MAACEIRGIGELMIEISRAFFTLHTAAAVLIVQVFQLRLNKNYIYKQIIM